MEGQASAAIFDFSNGHKAGAEGLPRLARIPAALTMAVGAISFSIWAAGLGPWMQPWSGKLLMAPMSGLLFMAAGVALWRVARDEHPDGVAAVLGALILVIAVLKISNYVFGWHFFPERSLAAHSISIERDSLPEISLNSGLAFACCGVALLLVHLRVQPTILNCQAFSLLMGLIGLVALVGYSYHVWSLYRIGVAVPMSLSSAICFVLLCMGMLAARPHRGVMMVITSQTTGGAIARRLLPVALAVPWIVGALLLMGEHAGYWQREFGFSIFAVSSTIIFSSLIWWNAQLLHVADLQKRRNEMRLAAQHEATRILAESTQVERAIPELLQRVGEQLEWKMGAFWLRDAHAQQLRCVEVWRSSRGDLEDLARASRNTALGKGQDLPGKVWATSAPVLTSGLNRAGASSRLECAAEYGLVSACALPVWTGQELHGVLEFFSSRIEQWDDGLREILMTISTQTGLFIERTQAEEQLRRASENLQRSNTDLQQFAYVASHDLFEPLRMVTSYLQLLTQRYSSQLPSQAQEFIHQALDGARRMDALIRDLLEYSRVEIRGQSFEVVETEQVLQAALLNLKVAIEESGAVITHGLLPRVMGDAVQLTQLFQNLIANALKFRGPNSPKVEVRAELKDGLWHFRVRDNGIGIDRKFFERIFVLFQRLHTREEYAGTGIGLAICKKIVERHGGRIWVESQPQQGSTFCFTIPEVKNSSGS